MAEIEYPFHQDFPFTDDNRYAAAALVNIFRFLISNGAGLRHMLIKVCPYFCSGISHLAPDGFIRMINGIPGDFPEMLNAAAELFPDPFVRGEDPDMEVMRTLFLYQGDLICDMKLFQGFYRAGKDIADLGSFVLCQFGKRLNMPLRGNDQETGNRDLRIRSQDDRTAVMDDSTRKLYFSVYDITANAPGIRTDRGGTANGFVFHTDHLGSTAFFKYKITGDGRIPQ